MKDSTFYLVIGIVSIVVFLTLGFGIELSSRWIKVFDLFAKVIGFVIGCLCIYAFIELRKLGE